MNVLVTGGAGFIGSNLVDRLLELDFDVHVIDNLSSGKIENVNNKAIFHNLDLNENKIENLFEKFKFNYVFHLAAQIDVRKSVEDPKFDADINIISTLKLLEYCYKFGCQKFIFSSSGGTVYGQSSKLPINEDSIIDPISPYGISKATIDQYLKFYYSYKGLKYTSLRYSNVYGPRQNPKGEAGVISIFLDKMLNEQNPIINGDGNQTRDFVFVEDVVDANLKAMNENIIGHFNIGTSKETSLNELFDSINQLFENKFNKVYGPEKPGELVNNSLDYCKYKEICGWEPHFNLLKGLQLTYNYFSQSKQNPSFLRICNSE